MHGCVNRDLVERHVALLLVAAFVSGCTGDASPRTTNAIVRDSAGVAIVEHVTPIDRSALAEWRVTDSLFPPIGEGEDEGPRALFRVSGGVRLHDGGVAIANGGTGEIRLFDASGEHRATFGRSGGGPGEFRTLTLLARRPGDTLVVYDAGQRRVSVLHPESGIVREQSLPSDAGRVVVVLPDGGMIGSGSAGGLLQPTDGLVRPQAQLRLLSADGALIRALDEYASNESGVSVSGQRAIIRTPPFARRTVFAAFGNGYVVADQAQPELRLFGRDGALERIVRIGTEVQPVTRAHLDAHLERVLASAPADGRASIRAGFEAMQLPSHLPAFGEVRVGHDSTIWVADHPEPGTERSQWTVLGSDGHALARVALPDRAVLLDVGADWVLMQLRDELDVMSVHLRRLARE